MKNNKFNQFKIMIKFILSLFILTFMIKSSFALQVKNTSTYKGNGRWNWTIFIDGSNYELNEISFVEYKLHPTFKNPIRKATNRENGFALSTNGWGTFVVKVKIHYLNQRIRELDHQLVFNQNNNPENMRNIRADNWSKEIEPGWWEWGVYIQASEEILNKIRAVEYRLHSSFPNPVRIVRSRHNKFELKSKGWGTFVIPIKVFFNDGTIIELNHQLIFK